MARSLVIVESPAKAKTINKYLGRNYTVKASYGHVMDLPKKTIGILLPGEQNGKKKSKRKTKGKGKAVVEKKPVKQVPVTAEDIYLAGDPDREGEAICYHLEEILSNPRKYTKVVAEKTAEIAAEADAESEKNGKNGDKPAASAKTTKKAVVQTLARTTAPKIYRVMFNEITQKAIKAAFEHPTQVNVNLVDAQQARRVLDRLVGYKVSPILWDKVRRGLSAGRVQTVALRLIVEREKEVRAFIPREYWTIHALLGASQPPSFEAKLVKYKGEDIEIPDQAESQRILA